MLSEGEVLATAEEQLNKIYTTILDIVSKGEQNNKDILSITLSVIVESASQSPIPLGMLGHALTLAGVLSDISVTNKFVGDLHSVVYIDTSNGSTRVYHPSFADYMQSQDRCGKYWIDKQETQALIASTCLKVMFKQLKFNMCQLGSSFDSNEDAKDLIQAGLKAVSRELVYSSYNWVYYVPDVITRPVKENDPHEVYNTIKQFLDSKHLVFWIELLSLHGHIYKLTEYMDILVSKLAKVWQFSQSQK